MTIDIPGTPNLYWSAPPPDGAVIVGTVTRDATAAGAAIYFRATDTIAQGNAGCVRSLAQQDARRELLRATIRYLDWTQHQSASYIGVHGVTVERWLAGTRRVPTHALLALLRAASIL